MRAIDQFERFQGIARLTDDVTAAHVVCLPGMLGTYTRKEIRDALRRTTVTVEDLESEGLIEVYGEKVKILSPGARAQIIKRKSDPLVIDKLHRLMYFYRFDPALGDPKKWISDTVIELLYCLCVIREEKEYCQMLDWIDLQARFDDDRMAVDWGSSAPAD